MHPNRFWLGALSKREGKTFLKIINFSSQYYVTWLYFWKNFRYGLSENEAGAKFFILDENGLITKARKNLLELEENFYSLTTFAEDDTSMEGMGLLEVL